MKKYICLTLICFSFSVFADNNSGLGQLGEASDSKNNCHRKEIMGCGPCFKLCMEHNSEESKGKDVASGSKVKTKSSSGSASKQ